MTSDVYIIGILNVTPDSFSDGSAFATPSNALAHANRLIDDGADIIDIGADSSRPGSTCVGVEEEWARLSPLIRKVASRIKVSVDTHHSEVARRALLEGAAIINDISGGSDSEMFRVVRMAGGQLILMYSASGQAHVFPTKLQNEDINAAVDRGLDTFLSNAAKYEFPRESLMLDTGIGAFISERADDSFMLLRHYGRYARFGLPLVLGCSRKGFLRTSDESSARDRDPASAVSSITALQGLHRKVPLYLRCHNVRLHRALIKLWIEAGLS